MIDLFNLDFITREFIKNILKIFSSCGFNLPKLGIILYPSWFELFNFLIQRIFNFLSKYLFIFS